MLNYLKKRVFSKIEIQVTKTIFLFDNKFQYKNKFILLILN